MREVDFAALDPVEFTLEKNALAPTRAICPRCRKNLKLRDIEAPVDSSISMRVKGFHCPRCGIQFFGLKDGAKLDRARAIAGTLDNKFLLERRLSFDGDNYTFRVPKELTRTVKKRRIHITPLGPNKFLARVE